MYLYSPYYEQTCFSGFRLNSVASIVQGYYTNRRNYIVQNFFAFAIGEQNTFADECDGKFSFSLTHSPLYSRFYFVASLLALLLHRLFTLAFLKAFASLLSFLSHRLFSLTHALGMVIFELQNCAEWKSNPIIKNYGYFCSAFQP